MTDLQNHGHVSDGFLNFDEFTDPKLVLLKHLLQPWSIWSRTVC